MFTCISEDQDHASVATYGLQGYWVWSRRREEEGDYSHCPIQTLHRYGLAGRIAALFPLVLRACVGRSEGYKEKCDMQEVPGHQRTGKGHQTRQRMIRYLVCSTETWRSSPWKTQNNNNNNNNKNTRLLASTTWEGSSHSHTRLPRLQLLELLYRYLIEPLQLITGRT